MLAIRLTRHGAKKKPFYRIVVAEKRAKRDGNFVEIVGYYNPCREPIELKLDQDRISYWIKCGAQPTETVRNLIRKGEQQPAAQRAGGEPQAPVSAIASPAKTPEAASAPATAEAASTAETASAVEAPSEAASGSADSASSAETKSDATVADNADESADKSPNDSAENVE